MNRRTSFEVTGAVRSFEEGGRSVTFVPFQIKRREARRLLVPPPGTLGKVQVDTSILMTVAKAHYWQGLIDAGMVKNGLEIALGAKLDPGWVSEVLRLTLLAPDIVTAIAEGRQPRHLTLQAVRREVPLEWEAQRRRLGFVADIE